MSEAVRVTPTPWEMDHGIMTRDTVNILDQSVEQDKYEAMIEAVRRDEEPITYYQYDGDPGYDGFWLVTGNKLAKEVLRRGVQYSSHGTQKGGGLMIHDLPADLADASDLMIMQDGDDHHRQRELVAKDFRQDDLSKVEGFLRSQAQTLVGNAVLAGDTDFVRDIAAPLPLAAIAEILSVPESERELVYKQGNKITMIDNPPGAASEMDMQAAIDIVDTAEALQCKVASGEVNNRTLKALQNAVYYPGEEPSEKKFITPLQFDMFFILLFLAGNETTRNSLAHGAKAFANNPKQWEALKADRSLVIPAADEIVRYATPVRYVRRTAMEDAELGDKNIQAGEKVVVSLTGANRDPAVFDRPHDFDITRNPKAFKEFIPFGQGPHFCLGRYLARLEIQVVLEEMLVRVDKIRPNGETERECSILINSLSSLPVILEPTA